VRSITELITAKRDGETLSGDEIRHVVDAYARHALPDEQMAALAMAIYFRGLDDGETSALVEAMLASGRTLDLSSLGPGRVDKHSTGGVGDKTSLILAPAAAAAGLVVPMVSGRGLGHTGGTIDKLESIPGFSADVEVDRFRAILASVGCAIIGQTADIAPADKRLYALRDVTATVGSLPLIVGSIMSKKLAEDIEGLVLDVKVGRAAFMKTLEDARALAKSMIAVGERMGVRVIAFLTRMEEPLGRMVGNACEVREAMDLLRGAGPADMRELVATLAGAMVEIATGADAEEARATIEATLDDGRAWARFEQMVAAQGGDLAALPAPAGETLIPAPRDGFVTSIDGLAIAKVCGALGAGRQRQGDVIDPLVGVRVVARRGDRVARGGPLCAVLHGQRGAPPAEARDRLAAAFSLGDVAPEPVRLVLERV